MTQPATFDERARRLTQSLLTDAERMPSRLPHYRADARPWKAIVLFAASVLVIGGAIVGASIALHRASVATPVPVSRATWRSFPLPDSGAGSAISCPNASECVALGFGNQVFFSGNPAGGTEAWKVASIEPAIPTQQDRQLTGISCPAPSLCVATDIAGNVVASTDPGGGADAWTSSRVASDATLSGISCPDINLCIAIGGTNAKVNPVGLVITSADPAGGSRAWNVTKVPGLQNLRSISCPTATFCVAIDGDGNVATSTDPKGGTSRVARHGRGVDLRCRSHRLPLHATLRRCPKPWSDSHVHRPRGRPRRLDARRT